MRSDRIHRIEKSSGEKFDLAGKVLGLAMKVHRALGQGFLESFAGMLEFKKKVWVYRQATGEPFRFRENSVNPVNSV